MRQPSHRSAQLIIAVFLGAALNIVSLGCAFAAPGSSAAKIDQRLPARAAMAAEFERGYKAAEDDDYPTAIRIWRELAEQGYVRAQYFMGLVYQAGKGITEDDGTAAHWYEAAAKQGHGPSAYRLGYFYVHGYGVIQNYEKAAHWYREAALQDIAGAQHNLGRLYLHGFGVEKNLFKASKWFEKGAKGGEVGAQFQFAVSYMLGSGVAQNDTLAYIWMTLAARQGDDDARELAPKLAIKLTEPQLEDAQKLLERFYQLYVVPYQDDGKEQEK